MTENFWNGFEKQAGAADNVMRKLRTLFGKSNMKDKALNFVDKAKDMGGKAKDAVVRAAKDQRVQAGAAGTAVGAGGMYLAGKKKGVEKKAALSESEEKAKKSYSIHLLGGRHKMTEDQKERTDLRKEISDRRHSERMDEYLKGTHPFSTAAGAGLGLGGAMGAMKATGALAGKGKTQALINAAALLAGGGAGHLLGRYGRKQNMSKLEAAEEREKNYAKSVL